MAMIQPLPPIPASAPAGKPGPGPNPVPLASPPEEPQAGNQAMDKAKTLMRQLMDQRRSNDSMAEQYPAAAKELRMANEALKAAMLKIVREVQQAPGSNPAPPVGGG
jgi:hypothetical protein